jgi:type I restriction enzyme M protein
MASEELQQRYPDGKGFKLGDFEVFECQLTTLNQFAEHGILPNKDYGALKTQKCDALVITREPILAALVIGEHKAPGQITDGNWTKLAEDLLKTKCQPSSALIGYLTDGISTRWINGRAEAVIEITREDGKAMPAQVDFKDKAFASEISHIIHNLDEIHSRVRAKARANPKLLAQQVWQTIWRLKADRPEDCLATFVELFLFKFLNDLGLMVRDGKGQDVSLKNIMELDREKSYLYYEQVIRPYVKELFPEGKDGFSIINGIVLQGTNRDHNIIFSELLKKFVRFGTLKNTAPEFKTRLYESFLQESKTTTTFGQFFTPRKVVEAIHKMAKVEELPSGKEICDPASGVGGFILEQMARDLDSQWVLKGNKMEPLHNWHGFELVPKTAILAKANALVHCGDLLADQPGRVKSFAKWLNEVFVCKDKTALGSLEDMPVGKYDLIITNPPFVVSGSADIGKLIKSNNKRKRYFGQKYSGVEGLFVQYVVQALKKNGDAWILLPETFFLRTTDQTLRSWILKHCAIDFLAILPERTFFNTPKRVVITHLKRRSKEFSDDALKKQLATEKVLLFAVGEIGETRDVKRLPTVDDLPQLVGCYTAHKAGAKPDKAIKQASSTTGLELFGKRSINLRHYWSKEIAKQIGLLGADEDPAAARIALDSKMKSVEALAKDWLSAESKRSVPPTPSGWKTVSLGDEKLFGMGIGCRVLKKDIYQKRTGVPLYSANIRKVFGFVDAANAGGLEFGGALWSIDSDFDCRGVSPGEKYAITDHCDQLAIKTAKIDPEYLGRQIRTAGIDYGFNRDFRPSLEVMATLEIDLPVTDKGEFDIELMRQWASYLEELDQKREELEKLMA